MSPSVVFAFTVGCRSGSVFCIGGVLKSVAEDGSAGGDFLGVLGLALAGRLLAFVSPGGGAMVGASAVFRGGGNGPPVMF